MPKVENSIAGETRQCDYCFCHFDRPLRDLSLFFTVDTEYPVYACEYCCRMQGLPFDPMFTKDGEYNVC